MDLPVFEFNYPTLLPDIANSLLKPSVMSFEDFKEKIREFGLRCNSENGQIDNTVNNELKVFYEIFCEISDKFLTSF